MTTQDKTYRTGPIDTTWSHGRMSYPRPLIDDQTNQVVAWVDSEPGGLRGLSVDDVLSRWGVDVRPREYSVQFSDGILAMGPYATEGEAEQKLWDCDPATIRCGHIVSRLALSDGV